MISHKTPMMQQWHTCKKKAKDAILLFRLGDFYEGFYEDAALLSKELDLTLTKRQEIPMSGVPFHTVESYIEKLVAKGYKVAIAEQIEEAKKGLGLVERKVVRVVTPGTITTSSSLLDKSNNFFASVTLIGKQFGLSFIDLTTSSFYTVEFSSEKELFDELFSISPSEILTHTRFFSRFSSFFEDLKKEKNFLLNTVEDWRYEHKMTFSFLIEHFFVHNLDGFGLKGMTAATNAAGALLAHIQDNLSFPISHVKEIHTYFPKDFMVLDPATLKNLELLEPLKRDNKENSLFKTLDQTLTPMGARLLKRWIQKPLLCPKKISRRQEVVEAFMQDHSLRKKMYTFFSSIKDLERLIMRISSGISSPKDLISLRYSLIPLEGIQKELLFSSHPCLREKASNITSFPEIIDLIGEAIQEEPPFRISDGNVIQEGFNQELDELKSISLKRKTWLLNYQENLKKTLGIKTLKVGYNKMFGFYIEVSKGQTDKIPDYFHRKQTLVNAERYISEELKEYETKILTAEEKILQMETFLYQSVKEKILPFTLSILKIAETISEIDCLLSFSLTAIQKEYVRPEVDESDLLHIKEGRHPVIENFLNSPFIPNDTFLDGNKEKLHILTGPNMAGKSTYIRQVAIIALMAHIGSYVPAKEAHIGIIDRIFTRVGASDDLARGQSTFMVEMTETANILHQVTSRSLIVLDEIGRGTSTYDGISIAWSVAEYLLHHKGFSKTLFATHYWELTQLEKQKGAVNYLVAVQEIKGEILFLRKIIRGTTDKSYGIHVAKLAGIPLEVIERAKEILSHLEKSHQVKAIFPEQKKRKKPVPSSQNEIQLTFFS